MLQTSRMGLGGAYMLDGEKKEEDEASKEYMGNRLGASVKSLLCCDAQPSPSAPPCHYGVFMALVRVIPGA